MVVVHHVFRPATTLQILEVRAELPVHASALGRAILAFQPEDFIDDIPAEPPPKLTSRTLGPAALRKGPAKGLTAAVAEAARGVSRELGARRWPAQL
jgi:DNA-binding IclR family transcriptional regulator